MKLRLTFDTKQCLDIIPHDTELGQKWFTQVQSTKNNNWPIRENNRIYNMNNEWPPQRITEEIIRCINVVNDYNEFINFKTNQSTLSQDQLNFLHHHFELLVGLDNAGSDFYDNAPSHVRQAIRDFNVNIHRLESNINRRIVVTFTDYKRTKLTLDDLALFTTEYKPGNVYINYCHTGKPLLDFFRDNDEHIFLKNILPQHCWKSDFIVGFYHRPIPKDWLENKWTEYKNIIPFVEGDIRNAIGLCPVGKIIGDPETICNQLYGIKEVIDYSFD